MSALRGSLQRGWIVYSTLFLLNGKEVFERDVPVRLIQEVPFESSMNVLLVSFMIPGIQVPKTISHVPCFRPTELVLPH